MFVFLCSWSRQHEKIEKLNMQAIINATAQENEFVKEFLINEEKFPVLIHQLMATEIWKEFVFPKLVEKKFEPKITFPLYMVVGLIRQKECISGLPRKVYQRALYFRRRISLKTFYQCSPFPSSFVVLFSGILSWARNFKNQKWLWCLFFMLSKTFIGRSLTCILWYTVYCYMKLLTHKRRS